MVLRILAPGLLAVVTVVLATGLPTPATTVVSVVRAATPLPEAAARPGPIVLCRGRELVGIDPDGRNERRLLAGTDVWSTQWFTLAPNGKRVAVVQGNDTPGFRVIVRSLAADGPEYDSAEFPGWGHVIWSGDGTELAVSAFQALHFIGGQGSARHVIVNVATTAQTPLKLPEDHLLADWSRDGRYFLTVQNEGARGKWLWVMKRDGRAHKSLTEGVASYCARFSPDGRRVLARVDPPMEMTLRARRRVCRLVSIDVATGAATHLADAPPGAAMHSFCWAPDGRRVAYILVGAPGDREWFSRVILCDADGRNPRTILSETATPEWAGRLPSQIDWR